MVRKVLLVCAGGMSTSILMKKLMKYAQENGIDLKIEAVGLAEYGEVCKNYSVILLGPQVSYKKAEVMSVAHMPVEVIAPADYAIGNAANVFRQIERIYPKQ